MGQRWFEDPATSHTRIAQCHARIAHLSLSFSEKRAEAPTAEANGLDYRYLLSGRAWRIARGSIASRSLETSAPGLTNGLTMSSHLHEQQRAHSCTAR